MQLFSSNSYESGDTVTGVRLSRRTDTCTLLFDTHDDEGRGVEVRLTPEECGRLAKLLLSVPCPPKPVPLIAERYEE